MFSIDFCKQRNLNASSKLVILRIKTIKLSNASLRATKHDMNDFFSFSGDVEYVEMQRKQQWPICLSTFLWLQVTSCLWLLLRRLLQVPCSVVSLITGTKLTILFSTGNTEQKSAGGDSTVQEAEDIYFRRHEMEFQMEQASKHIAVMAFPFGTHAAPLLNLVLRLSHACPDTVFSFLSTQQSNTSTFPMKLDKVKPFNVWDGLPEGYRFGGNPHEPVQYFLKAVPGNFTVALDKVVAESGKPIDCLITDAFYAFGADIADELNVPWVALWTAGPRALFVHVDTDSIRRQVGINGSQDKPLDFLPDFSGLRVADLPDGITSGDFDAPVPALLNKMGQALPRATAIAANSYEDLDNTVVNILKQRFKLYLNTGPFNLLSSSTVDDSHGCLDWLSKQGPATVVYISFGSVITPPPHELQALCEALEETEFPFLWSFRGNPEKDLPQGFLERRGSKGKIVPWAPQQKILEHSSVGVFVSHGGWNSVLESIVGGVPMIFRPFFGDQGLNTRTVEAVWGFGLGLEGGTLTKEGAMKALKLTLCSEQGKKMRDRIGVQKLLAYDAVKPNGSSVENFKTLVKVVSNS